MTGSIGFTNLSNRYAASSQGPETLYRLLRDGHTVMTSPNVSG